MRRDSGFLSLPIDEVPDLVHALAKYFLYTQNQKLMAQNPQIVSKQHKNLADSKLSTDSCIPKKSEDIEDRGDKPLRFVITDTML
jgi:hypothetical protein